MAKSVKDFGEQEARAIRWMRWIIALVIVALLVTAIVFSQAGSDPSGDPCNPPQPVLC